MTGFRSARCTALNFARDTGLLVTVAYYLPGTSNWNKVEHRRFSFITQNWRGRPLLSVQTVVSLIANRGNGQALRTPSRSKSRFPK